MSETLTATAMLDEIREAREGARIADQEYRDNCINEAAAKADYRGEYNRALIEAKEKGDTDTLAKARAEEHAHDHYEFLLGIEANRRAAKNTSSTWHRVLDALTATAHVLNREMRMVGQGIGAGP